MKSSSLRVLLVVALVGLLVCQADACPSPGQALPGAQTTWDGTFQFECPGNQVIRRISSVHCGRTEDRVWKFGCGSVLGLSRFDEEFWSEWINDYDGVMNFECPFNALVTGFRSEHSNRYEDRRWNVKCSRKYNMVTFNCALSPYANSFDDRMNYAVSSGYYLRGMHGDHSNYYEDRRYKFNACRIRL
ncbi:PREDICTED: hemagglutinin/amebocyte aggregation factor-like [Branchiostoma belcheri]|uniref:Hemagglutinin/amebocyte aggregation factor-like n=1 Tax=Branchiostoma belcheri TaxID=7741 RepID=A0A6P4YAH6_BRABE|nr:PREDICTED: hemagglutinin/amebocyte aggregation factor-like [Branchiostoma belcheri]